MTRVLLAGILLAVSAVGALIARPTVPVNMFVDEEISMKPYGDPVGEEEFVNSNCIDQMYDRWNAGCDKRITASL